MSYYLQENQEFLFKPRAICSGKARVIFQTKNSICTITLFLVEPGDIICTKNYICGKTKSFF